MDKRRPPGTNSFSGSLEFGSRGRRQPQLPALIQHYDPVADTDAILTASTLNDVRRILTQRILRTYGQLPRPLKRFLVRLATPSFTAGAVALVERDDGRILMVRLAYLNGWSLPGGHLDRGESPVDAARRETEEEVGLAVDLLGDPAVVVDPVLRRIDNVFWSRPGVGVDPDSAYPRSAELLECGWFFPDNLPSMNFITRATLWAVSSTWARHGGTVPSWAPAMAEQLVPPDPSIVGGSTVTPIWSTQAEYEAIKAAAKEA